MLGQSDNIGYARFEVLCIYEHLIFSGFLYAKNHAPFLVSLSKQDRGHPWREGSASCPALKEENPVLLRHLQGSYLP